jgi:multisubunit Na+/H+ antiporter MnhE subunit
MKDRSITIVFASMLGFCMLAVMACTVWILFTGSAIELALGILGSAVSVYMFIDVSREIK